MTTTQSPVETGQVDGFEPVCRLDQIRREGGVAALVRGEAVAVFRTHDDRVFALSNIDPATGSSVLSRGIVGTKQGVDYVASPLLKHPYALATGECLDDPSLVATPYDVALVDGVVHVGARQGGA